ncbi:molybdenum cofactor guanylyltransferase [Thalassolituus maritimus]|uniref:Molybdenum cofactor guanylyltransferase n=1 Tax=Thalassolituus maritimus TaxID=484498 RepID=A0A1N7KAR6_9GAMM|nr:molybdenum cofactor guanylyltransferase [Thalassolituus maritimus]SIS58695.1 molybdenum cofactor guanylyltransferase [Thalassolituus maritimus]
MKQTATAASEQITAVILAGGKSERMGRDKAQLIRPDGRSQLSFTADCLREAGIEDILVSGAGLNGLKSIKDIYPEKGPLAGIHSALAHCKPDTDSLIVVPCDMPLLKCDVFSSLLKSSQSTAFDQSFFPLIIRNLEQAKEVAENILSSDQNPSVRSFLKNMKCDFISSKNTVQLKSCNTPESWNDACNLLNNYRN